MNFTDTVIIAQKGAALTQEKRVHRVPVSNGVFASYKQLGDAIWLHVYLTDKITSEVRNAKTGIIEGIVLYGHLCNDTDIAVAFNCDPRTIRRWRKKLAILGYAVFEQKRGRGYSVRVLNSCKWPNKLRTEMSAPSGLVLPTVSGVDGHTPTNRVHKVSRNSNNPTDIAAPTETTRTENKQQQQKVVADSDELRLGIFGSYKKARGRNPKWRKAEAAKLRALLEEYTPKQVLGACENWLQNGNEWDVTNSFPFCSFAVRIGDYLPEEPHEERDVTVEYIRPPADYKNSNLVRIEDLSDGKRASIPRELADALIRQGKAMEVTA